MIRRTCLRRSPIALTCLIAGMIAGTALAAGEGEKAPSPEEAAMMAAWMKAATPGEHHAHHAKLAGAWKAAVSFWPAAGAPAQPSEGTVTMTSMMDGRYVHEEMKGISAGMPFHGAGLSGYDNVTGRHWSIWVDNMSTGLASSWGTCDAGHKTVTSKGEMPDAMTGKMQPFRSVARFESDDRMVYEMYGNGKDGKEYRTLEVIYTRQK